LPVGRAELIIAVEPGPGKGGENVRRIRHPADGEISNWISHLSGGIRNAVGGDFNGKLDSVKKPRYLDQRYSKWQDACRQD
jgi:hypothetical protein